MKKEKKPVTFKTLLIGFVFAAVVFGGIYFFVYHFMLSAFRRAIPIP